jgi:hypothetical protein
MRCQSSGPGVETASTTVVPLVLPEPLLPVPFQTANDRAWDMNQIIKRPFVLSTLTWDNTTTNGTILQSLALPQAFESQPILNNIYSTFTISRFKIKLTFTLTGTKFHQGALMCAWRPMTGPNSYETPSIQTNYLTPHCFLRADVPNTIEMEIPFIFDSSYYPYYMDPTKEPFGYINILVFSQLAYATGASPVLTLSITGAIEEIEFHIPRTVFTAFSPTPSLKNEKTYLEDKKNRVKVMRPQMMSSPDQPATSAGANVVPVKIGMPVGRIVESRRDRINSIRDMVKRMVPIAKANVVPTGLGTDNTVFSCPQIFDGSLIYHPWFGNSPLAMYANMYRLCRGSVRYELDITVDFQSPNTHGLHNVHAYMMFLPKYFPGVPASDGRTSIYQAPSGGNSAVNMQPVVNIDPALGGIYAQTFSDIFQFLPKAVTSNYTPSSGTSSITGINSFNFSPFVMFAPLVGTTDGFSCSLAIEVPFCHNRHAYRVPNYYPQSVPGFYDGAWPADGPVPAYTAVNSDSPYPRSTPFGPAHSPGTVVFGLFSNNPTIGGYAPPEFSFELHGSAGDDFRLGCLADLPPMYLQGNNYVAANNEPGFGIDMAIYHGFLKDKDKEGTFADGNVAVDNAEAERLRKEAEMAEYYKQIGSIDQTVDPELLAHAPPALREQLLAKQVTNTITVKRPQGNTINTMTTYNGAVSGSNPINVTGDKFDTKADISIPADAMATAMDKPSFNVQLPGTKIHQMNYRANSTGIYFGERQALCGSDVDDADPNDFGTDKDEMSFEYLRSIPGIVADFGWATSALVGSLLAEVPISPFILDGGNDGFKEPTPTNSYRLSMLAQTCLPFVFWRGSLNYRLRLFASGFHTGKLFISVNYHPYRTGQPNALPSAKFLEFEPATEVDAMSQYGMYVDLSTDNADITFNCAYVSHEMFTYVNHWQANRRNNIGTISFLVIQPLVAVPGTQPTIQCVLEQWAGDDFSTHSLAPPAVAWSDRPPTLTP